MPGCVAAMRARGPPTPMWMSWWPLALAALLVMLPLPPSNARLSPGGTYSNPSNEVVALMAIKAELEDPRDVLQDWAIIYGYADPCTWSMISCSSDGYVSNLTLRSRSLSGKLSPAIGNLTRLNTLDMSDNQLTGSIPSSLGNLKNLKYLLLNNNSLSGVLPESLTRIDGLAFVDISFNNLSGPLPKISARTFIISGNPMICGDKSQDNCSSVSPDPPSSPPDDLKTHPQQGTGKSHHIAATCGAIVGSVAFLLL